MNGWVIFRWVLVSKEEWAGLHKVMDDLIDERKTAKKERDAWESRAHEVETERNELREQVGGLKLERDEALRPKSPPPSDGTGKRRIKGKSTMEPPSTA